MGFGIFRSTGEYFLKLALDSGEGGADADTRFQVWTSEIGQGGFG